MPWQPPTTTHHHDSEFCTGKHNTGAEEGLTSLYKKSSSPMQHVSGPPIGGDESLPIVLLIHRGRESFVIGSHCQSTFLLQRPSIQALFLTVCLSLSGHCRAAVSVTAACRETACSAKPHLTLLGNLHTVAADLWRPGLHTNTHARMHASQTLSSPATSGWAAQERCLSTAFCEST